MRRRLDGNNFLLCTRIPIALCNREVPAVVIGDHIGLLEECSTQCILSVVGRSFQWKIFGRVGYEGVTGRQVERCIRESNINAYSSRQITKREGHIWILSQKCVVLRIVEKVEFGGVIPCQVERILKKGACFDWKPNIRQTRI